MIGHDTEIRAAKLVDLPFIGRVERGAVLDAEFAFTRTAPDPHSAVLSSIFLPQRGLHTLVGRDGRQQIVGQLRLKPADHLAQIVYMAPPLEPNADDTVWLRMMDALAAEAGRRGAHMLTAEVAEDSPLFTTMRASGFAVYARQEIWARPSDQPLPAHINPAPLTEDTEEDSLAIQLLYSNIVPRLVQPIAVPSRDSEGLVYRHDGRIQGYIAVSEGKCGIYLMPFLHPDILFSEASAIIAGAIVLHPRADRLPVYVCVRRYQDWLEDGLVELGFKPWTQQAVMVRHIAAGVRHASFAPISAHSRALDGIPNPIRPPTSQTKSVLEVID
jgi:hypothetical protein